MAIPAGTMTSMLTHHFTIVQLKSLYVNDACKAFWFYEGLHPSDGIRMGLIPVLALTLNVEGLGLYHQRYYRHDEEISLANFFHDAWMHSRVINGIPERLCVDKDLIECAPVLQALRQVDATGQIKQVVTNAGKTFGPSKAQAQKRAENALWWHDLSQKPQPESVDSLLRVMSKNHEDYEDFCLEVHPYISSSKWEDFLQFKERTPVRPIMPVHPAPCRLDFGWVSKSAQKVPRLSERRQYNLNFSERDWIHWLSLRHQDEQDEQDDYDCNNAGIEYYWASETDGLAETLRTLPYPLDESLPESLSNDQMKAFLSSREPLSKFRIGDLENMLRSLPLIIFPKTAKASRLAFEYLSHGGDCEYMHELVAGHEMSASHRIFVCYGYSLGLFLIVIKSGSKADVPRLTSGFFSLGEGIDIGPAGLAALMFWINKVERYKTPYICSLVLAMVQDMINACDL